MIDTDNARAYEDALKKIYSSGNHKNLLRDYSLDCFDLLKGVEVYKSVYSNLLNTENS